MLKVDLVGFEGAMGNEAGYERVVRSTRGVPMGYDGMIMMMVLCEVV